MVGGVTAAVQLLLARRAVAEEFGVKEAPSGAEDLVDGKFG